MVYNAKAVGLPALVCDEEGQRDRGLKEHSNQSTHEQVQYLYIYVHVYNYVDITLDKALSIRSPWFSAKNRKRLKSNRMAQISAW